MVLTTLQLAIPDWVGGVAAHAPTCASDESKVALAVDLSRRNIDTGTGGPFGAVVFGPDGRVVSVGVNAVLTLTTSVAHAEILALMLAQRQLGRVRLNRDADDRPMGPYTLATSSQPCCQCYGALVWAGIDRLLIGARAEDVAAETEFDEGPLPADWVGQLQRRGIEVVRDLCRDQARLVLHAYTASGGSRY